MQEPLLLSSGPSFLCLSPSRAACVPCTLLWAQEAVTEGMLGIPSRKILDNQTSSGTKGWVSNASRSLGSHTPTVRLAQAGVS